MRTLTRVGIGILVAASSLWASPSFAAAAGAGPELNGVNRLLAMEEMKNLRLSFCRALDAHDWPALRATMADDFELYWVDETGNTPPLMPKPVEMKGADNFVEFAKQVLARGKSVHVCTMPQFQFVGVDHARALWTISGFGQIGAQNGEGLERIVEDYVRVGGKWRVQKADARIVTYIMFPK